MGRIYQIAGLFCVYLVFHYVWQVCKGIKYRKLLFPIVAAQLFFVMIGYFHLSIPILTYLLIGGVGIPALINGIMFDPNILLIVAATYLPFNLLLPGTFGGFATAFNLTNVVLIAILISLVISKKANSGKNYSISKSIMVLLGAYVVLSLMSYVKGSLYFGLPYLMAFAIPIKRWLTPVIIFILFYKMIKGRDIIKMISAILMLMVIINITYGVLQWVNFGFATYSDFKRRLTGLSGHPNFFGAFIAYYFGLIAGPFLTDFRKNSGKFLLFPLLLGVRIIIPTNSRGGWLALASALPVLSVFRSKLTILLLIFGVCLVVIFPDILIPETVRMRVGGVTQTEVVEEDIYTVHSATTVLSESKEISIKNRWDLMEAGLEMAKENIWFGSGWGVFPFRIGDYNPRLRRASAHNIWIQMLCEMGLLTVVSLLLALAYLFKAGVYVVRRERDPMLKGVALGFIAAVPAVIVANMTGNRFDAEELMYPFWILAACVLQLRNIIQTERTQERYRPT